MGREGENAGESLKLGVSDLGLAIVVITALMEFGLVLVARRAGGRSWKVRFSMGGLLALSGIVIAAGIAIGIFHNRFLLPGLVSIGALIVLFKPRDLVSPAAV